MPRFRGASRGAPDLAVEIVSPSEYAYDVDEKGALYLAAGT
ncbi:MAG: Uma2 family endonuclease, partial [Acidobacteria bacterium]|nr:Uma2 family endonuclease [Acidobacteriota bacterium]